MRMAADQWDWYESYASKVRTLIARKGLYCRIFRGAQEINNLDLMSVMARKIDWAHDIALCHIDNAETSLKLAKNYEYRARMEWAHADGKEIYGTYED
jgi:hypothetical protein